MNRAQLVQNLCTYDERNPLSADLTDDDNPVRRPGEERICSCDNCFYRRHQMAEALLRVLDVVEHYEGLTGAGYTYIAGDIRKAMEGRA